MAMDAEIDVRDQNRTTWGLEAEHGPDPALSAPRVVMSFPLELTYEFPHGKLGSEILWPFTVLK